MSCTIHPLRNEDEGEWRALWSSYLRFYETEVPESVYRTCFARLLSGNQGEFQGLLARDKSGTAVGLAHYLFHRDSWSVENVCYLQDLYVDESTRGTGIGRLLIEAVYAAADEANHSRVYWLTQDSNTQARQLYDRLADVTPFVMYERN